MADLEDVKKSFTTFLKGYNITLSDYVADAIFKVSIRLTDTYELFLIADELKLEALYIPRLFKTTKSSAPTLLCQSNDHIYLNHYNDILSPMKGPLNYFTSHLFQHGTIEIIVWMNIESVQSYVKCEWVTSENITTLSGYDLSNGYCRATTNVFMPKSEWDVSGQCEDLSDSSFHYTNQMPNTCPNVCEPNCKKINMRSVSIQLPGYVAGCRQVGGNLYNIQNDTFITDLTEPSYNTILRHLSTACNASVQHPDNTPYLDYQYEGNYCPYLQEYGKVSSQTGSLWTTSKHSFSCTNISGECNYSKDCSLNSGNPVPPDRTTATGPCIPNWMAVNTTYSWWWGGGQRNFMELPFPFYYFNAFSDRYGRSQSPKQCGEGTGWGDSSYCLRRWQSLHGPSGNAGDEITCEALKYLGKLLAGELVGAPLALVNQCHNKTTSLLSVEALPTNNLRESGDGSYASNNFTVQNGEVYPRKGDFSPAMNVDNINNKQSITKLMKPTLDNSYGLNYTLLSNGKRITKLGASGGTYLTREELIYDTSYVTMNDPSWGTWSWAKWDWVLKDGTSLWQPGDCSVCWPNFKDGTPFNDLKNNISPHYHRGEGVQNPYVLDFMGIYKAALAGIGSKQYAPFFTIASAGEASFESYILDSSMKLGANVDDENGIWQMTGLEGIIGNDPNGLGNNKNYLDIICKAPITECDKLPQDLREACTNAAVYGDVDSNWTTYFASVKNPCCCAKLAKFWMDNNDPQVGQSCFSTNSNVLPSWGGGVQCQINAPLQVPWAEHTKTEGTMDAYQQGTGQMLSAYNTNFLGPICHLSGTKSGGTMPSSLDPVPICPVGYYCADNWSSCSSQDGSGTCATASRPCCPNVTPSPVCNGEKGGACYGLNYGDSCKHKTDISCTISEDPGYKKCSEVARCSDYHNPNPQFATYMCCKPGALP